MTDKVKIYAFGMGGIDWVAAANKQDAIECMKSVCDCYDEEEVEIRELTDAEMDKLQFIEDIYAPKEEQVFKSFRQKLAERIAAGDKFPDMFATTEY